MSPNLKIFIQIDNNTIYEFQGRINERIMIECANHIEKLLIENKVKKEKVQNIFELFIETVQNILNYSYNTVHLSDAHKETSCYFTLSYITNQETYILDSCNLIKNNQKRVIEKKINFLKDFNNDNLRKLIRQKGRSKEDSHSNGAGLGYIMMTKKSSSPIEISFIPYHKDILIYKQRLYI